MIGIDLVHIPRIRKAIESEAFVMRVFTENERAYAAARPDAAESYAGMFCAKEAAVKAFKSGFCGEVMPLDIEITHDPSGAPSVVPRGKTAAKFADRIIEVSISHDGDYAVAVVSVSDGNDKLDKRG